MGILMKKIKLSKEMKKTKDSKIIFSFDYIHTGISTHGKCEEESDDSDETLEILSYEKHKFIEYWYSILLDSKTKTDNGEENFCYTNVFIVFLNYIKRKNSVFNEFQIFKKFSLKKLCDDITNIPFIQTQLAKNVKELGYPCIEENVFYKNAKIMSILKKQVNLVLSELKDYLDNVNFDTLDKAYYTKQLDAYVKLTNLNTQKDLYYFIQYVFYRKLKLFFEELYNPLKYLRNKFPTLGSIQKYKDFLFYSDKFISYKLSDIKLNVLLLNNLYTKYDSVEDFIDSILVKAKNTELNLKNFSYVNEVDYILSILKNALKNKKKGINILLYGPPGTGKTELARVLVKCSKADGYEIAEIDNNINNINNKGSDCYGRRTLFAINRFILDQTKNSVLIFDEAEDYFRTKNVSDNTKININKMLEENNTPTIWTTNSLGVMEESYIRRFTYVCNVEYMPKDVYLKIYKNLCDKYDIVENTDVFDLCFENKASVGIIKKAFETYKMTKSKNLKLLMDDIKNTLKGQSYGYFSCKNTITRPKNFDTKLLNTSDNLEQFAANVKKIKRLDFSLLLYGVSGSGKSYYAEYLAEQLGIPVIKKKASDLESCWVGETEKNIAKAFEEAKIEKAMLIIDEGDHFIADRSTSHYSWERSRTEEMLQQIEVHSYPVVFTTNLMENIDKAAMRRFTYKTKFDYLTIDQVKIAWKDYFPDAELPQDIYLSRLCPGDFATVYKKASFEGYLTDTSLLYAKLEEEMRTKKEMENSSIRF